MCSKMPLGILEEAQDGAGAMLQWASDPSDRINEGCWWLIGVDEIRQTRRRERSLCSAQNAMKGSHSELVSEQGATQESADMGHPGHIAPTNDRAHYVPADPEQ